MKQRPDIHRAWLERNSMLSCSWPPRKCAEVSKLADTNRADRPQSPMASFTVKSEERRRWRVKVQQDFIVNERRKAINEAWSPVQPAQQTRGCAEIRDGGIDDGIARDVLAKRGLTSL